MQSPAFPSGHTSFAHTDATLIGMMVPELYQSMMVRASQYGNSRIVLGVHYARDVVGGRSLAQYDLAQALANPDYINNSATTGAAINLPGLFQAAAPELNSYLSAGCGASVASCAASQSNPFAPSAANAAAYAVTLTYGMLGALATRTVNQILVNTETNALAAFYGASLSYWSRINLYSAAGYFGGVTGGLRTRIDRRGQDQRHDRLDRQNRRDGHNRWQRDQCRRGDRARRRDQAGRRAGRHDNYR